MSLEPGIVPSIAADAIEAHIVHDEDGVADALNKVLVEGTKGDALTFTLSCMFTFQASLSRGRDSSAGPVVVTVDKAVTLIDDGLHGQRLFAEMLADFLIGDHVSAVDRFLHASDEDACGAVGTALLSAAHLLKQRRAVLN